MIFCAEDERWYFVGSVWQCAVVGILHVCYYYNRVPSCWGGLQLLSNYGVAAWYVLRSMTGSDCRDSMTLPSARTRDARQLHTNSTAG